MAGTINQVLGFLSGSLGQWVAGAQPTQVGLRETLVPRQGAVEVTASQVPQTPTQAQSIGTQKQAGERAYGVIERREWSLPKRAAR